MTNEQLILECEMFMAKAKDDTIREFWEIEKELIILNKEFNKI